MLVAVLKKIDLSRGKPISLPDGLTNQEVVNCYDHFCRVSYTMAYGIGENRIQGGQKVPDVMREKANKVIGNSHPVHSVEMYIWGGIEKGWLDKVTLKKWLADQR